MGFIYSFSFWASVDEEDEWAISVNHDGEAKVWKNAIWEYTYTEFTSTDAQIYAKVSSYGQNTGIKKTRVEHGCNHIILFSSHGIERFETNPTIYDF